MPTQTEAWASAQWLYSTLNVSAVTTLATGGVYRGTAPAAAVAPYVVMRMPTAQDDLMVVGAVRIWSPQLWDIIAIGTSLQWQVVDKIAAAVDALLHKGSGVPSSGIVHECTRERPISFDEVDEGVTYVYVGATYLLKATAV
jgi:hypothetical protein